MTTALDLELFIRAGHCTREAGTILEPVTIATHYRATNGFYYYVGWKDRLPVQMPLGYSAAYLSAERDYERDHGTVDNDTAWQRQAQYIAQELGLL